MRRWGCELIFILLAIQLGTGVAGAAEPACYRTVGEAAAHTGRRGVEGFRLEAVRQDPFSGLTWAVVLTCSHPERPGTLMVVAAGAEGSFGAAQRAATVAPLLMLAGTRVRVDERGEHVSLEYSGIAQGSGRAGDRVRVRLLPISSGDNEPGPERFADGIIRARDLVEVEEP